MGYVEVVMRDEGHFQRLYARKRLHLQHRNDTSFRRMFIDEARLSGLVRHPNVVSVVDVGEDNEGPFLIMDYVEGVSTATVMEECGQTKNRLPVQIATRIALEAMRGLHAAHEARGADGIAVGLVHRDVSPQNILIGFDGTVRVTDFGIAKALGNLSHTNTGILKGNLGYLSPEQLRFEDPDRRSDLFSMGVVLFELLSGQRLYVGDEAKDGLRRILHEPPPDVGQFRRDVPAALTELLFELLTKDPALRPPSAQDVVGRLEQILGDLVAAEGPLEIATHMQLHFGVQAMDRRQQIAGLVAAAKTPPPPKRRSILSRITMFRIVTGGALAVLVASGLLWRSRSRLAVVPVETGPSGSLWAGGWHSCATDRGALMCWGKNNEGQLGIGNWDDSTAPQKVAPFPSAVRSAGLGWFHTCVCLQNGDVYCWGRNAEGQLGTKDTAPSLVPKRVASLSGCKQIAAGDRHSCVVRHDGTIACWGANGSGQVAQTEAPLLTSPTRIEHLGDVVQVAASEESTCAVQSAGTVMCWGLAIGVSTKEGGRDSSRFGPRLLVGVTDAVEVSVGRSAACVRRRGGQVACWGEIGEPKEGIHPLRTFPSLEPIADIEDARQLTLGAGHGCSLSKDGQVRCFWSDYFGQLGISKEKFFAQGGVPPEGVGRVVAIATGEVHTCVRHAQGISCWGANSTGQLGDGSREQRRHAVSVIGMK